VNERVLLITGANGGLGQAIARAFLAESPSNTLFLGVHTRRDAADALAAEHPARCHVLPLDVTRPEAWAQAVAHILNTAARLDVLVHNAGRHDDALLAQMAPAAWRDVLAINLDAVFHGCQAALPVMLGQRHGRIITISSLSALLAPPGQTNYAAAKAGVLALTQSLAKETARAGITVNAVCPGYIETEALAGMAEPQRQAARAQVPMRRFGRPEEVAAAVRFLASADAAYITGATLKVDGGIF
jgi:3-oxoacyl-[acyl-carrier protein] reductase